jgi:acetylornithine/succinyldiaminopimelate/putrescine aminotransferase
VFDTIESEGLLERVTQAGDYLGGRLGQLVARYPKHAVEARGRGLLRGLVVAGNPVQVVARCREGGVLLSVAGDHTVRFAPPYVVDRAQLDEAVAIVDAALAEGCGGVA